MTQPTLLLARSLLAAIFVVSGVRKIFAFAATSAMMAKIGLPLSDLLLAASILLDIVGGALLVLGFQTRIVAPVLAVYTLVLAFIFHAFWGVPEAQYVNQLNHFLKNLGVAGGLILLAAWPSERDDTLD